ncbi:MAG: aspartate carbamoyltransferase [Methylovulum sp.]|uniref:aspartate carbamoyltransferase n=1 Tax=Methylovulum sp. TaxID=1916980 RepID=UPI00261D9AD2|nr:aspartate carbamoyltransferase [Methylovulum sp.]MDD2724541.1 aspartate carbamoyltransferase [Methylovulum sp.]MDD5124028.1 aspartate carbamoyltransferase [Methylovulum sp.]
MNKICLALGLLMMPSAYAVQPASPARLDEVVARGVHVMPFDLDKTQHVFTQTDTGGIQQVLAKDANDHKQIGLIRDHLSALAKCFGEGDFSGPMRIHGDTMPGVQDLRTGFSHIQFAYRELADGAQIAYVSTDPKLIAAVHQYFDAQLSDHARHAIPGGSMQHHGH